MSSKNWFPLESNPSIMTSYVQSLGVDTSVHAFHDVLSVESWAVEMVPGPILGTILYIHYILIGILLVNSLVSSRGVDVIPY